VLDDTDQSSLLRPSGGTGLATSELIEAIEPSPRVTPTPLAHLVGSGLVREIGTVQEDSKRRSFLSGRGPS
jgi:hypothetical protein